MNRKRLWITHISLLLLFSTSTLAHASEYAQEASHILQSAGIKGGLIVHVGCADGRLTAALGQRDCYTVQGLERDAGKLQQARQHILSLGQYGRVSVSQWDGKHLPYTKGLVNLIVVEDSGTVEAKERLRVLAPCGVALIRQGDAWIKQVKPWPREIDEWPHYLYGPDNNAVSQDKVVGPPQHMQWVCGPKYARSHEINSSMAAMVSAGGRLFYIWDEGPIGLTDPRFPAKWSLLARDGFNGTLLWKRAMPNWGWRQWHAPSRWDDKRERAKMLRHLPSTLPRRLVGADERLYVTLGYEAPVSVLDAATGAVMQEIEQTALTDEILLDRGTLVLRVRTADHRPDRDVWSNMSSRQRGRVMAVDARTGRVRWQSKAEAMAPLTLATRAQHIYYSNYDQVVCLDRANGQEIWRTERMEGKQGHRGTAGTLVAQDKVLLYANVPPGRGGHFGQVRAYAAETGKLLWAGPQYAGPGVTNPPDLFVAKGLVWLGEARLPVGNMETTMERQGFDLLTGQVIQDISVPKLTSPGHHYRCYRSKATERYLMLPKRGIEFLDLVEKDHMRHDWLRPPCIYGILPSNGMLYVAPHQCVCYQGVLMSNFNAVKAHAEPGPKPITQEERLQRGPAWGKVKAVRVLPSTDWPMYRQNPQRSGSVVTELPKRLGKLWEAALGTNITAPVVADGRLLVADVDTHTIHALDARTGQSLWCYTAGGRIDSAPSVYGPLVLFGSADGWVYCLGARDGAEVWCFLAAPQERRITAFGQVESAWPVHGSVLVQKDSTSNPARDLVYFTAGRSSYLDGGIFAYALDPQTGKLIHQTCLKGPRPDPYRDRGGAGYMDGSKSDILVSDGADLFLFQERLSSELKRFPAPMQSLGKERGGWRVFPPAPERGSTAKHMISTRGFLDDSYNEGTYWTYSARWPGWDRHMGGVPAYGQILSFDKDRLYGVHVFYESVRVRRGFSPGTKGYRLYARDHAAKKDRWSIRVPVRVRAMVAAGKKLFVAGPPDVVPESDALAAFEGRQGALLWAFSGNDGQKLAEVAKLDALPVYDGLIAAAGRLYMSLKDGRVMCFGKETR